MRNIASFIYRLFLIHHKNVKKCCFRPSKRPFWVIINVKKHFYLGIVVNKHIESYLYASCKILSVYGKRDCFNQILQHTFAMNAIKNHY